MNFGESSIEVARRLWAERRAPGLQCSGALLLIGTGFKKPPSSRPRASGNRSTGLLSVSGAGPL